MGRGRDRMRKSAWKPGDYPCNRRPTTGNRRAPHRLPTVEGVLAATNASIARRVGPATLLDRASTSVDHSESVVNFEQPAMNVSGATRRPECVFTASSLPLRETINSLDEFVHSFDPNAHRNTSRECKVLVIRRRDRLSKATTPRGG